MPKFRRDTEWDWDAMPMHPTTRRYEGKSTQAARTGGTSAPASKVSPTHERLVTKIGEKANKGQSIHPRLVGATTKGKTGSSTDIFSKATRQALYKRPISAEMYLTAAGSRLAQHVLAALRHEGKPSHVSSEKYLQRFARSGWDEEETAQANRVLALWSAGHKVRASNGGFYQQDTPTPEPATTPEPEFVDPCQGKTGDDLLKCYRDTLQSYGVGLADANDLIAHPDLTTKLGEGGLEEFSAAQLEVILEGVYLTGQKLAGYVSTVLGREVTAAEAFQMIYGSIEFGYDPSREGTGLTVATGSDLTDLSNTIYILLDDSTLKGYESLPDSFVVVHELGHAFTHRHGDPNIDTYDFVENTNSVWNPTSANQYRPIDVNLAERLNLQKYISEGKQVTDDKGRPLYIVPPEYYFALGFSGGTSAQPQNYFSNELGQRSPEEGFADVYSHFMTDPYPLTLQGYSQARFDYFDQNMPQWIKDILCHNGEINCG